MSCGSLLYHAILALADKPSVPLGYILLCLCGSAIEQTNAQCQRCGYSCAHMFFAMKSPTSVVDDDFTFSGAISYLNCKSNTSQPMVLRAIR